MAKHPYTAADDKFHFDQMDDRWWATETCWFSFHNAARKLGGWLYIMVRPNIGTVAGGAWVWDASAHLPHEVPYCANYTALRLRDGSDLRDVTLPTGVSVKVLEPLTSYQLGFQDADRLQINLRFDAIMAPEPLTSTKSGFGHLSHFDQFGRVHGQITLHGEDIAIDCLSMRDRSWGPRPEHRPKHTAYITGIASPKDGFLVVTNPSEPDDPITAGFLLRDGVVSPFASGNRQVISRLPDGRSEVVLIKGQDVLGRAFAVTGTAQSNIAINRHAFVDSNSLMQWDMGNGLTGWGEEQDCCPIPKWSAMVRSLRSGQTPG